MSCELEICEAPCAGGGGSWVPPPMPNGREPSLAASPIISTLSENQRSF